MGSRAIPRGYRTAVARVDLAKAVRVGVQPEPLSVVTPRWIEARGRSDLSLGATIEDRAEGSVVEIGTCTSCELRARAETP